MTDYRRERQSYVNHIVGVLSDVNLPFIVQNVSIGTNVV